MENNARSISTADCIKAKLSSAVFQDMGGVGVPSVLESAYLRLTDSLSDSDKDVEGVINISKYLMRDIIPELLEIAEKAESVFENHKKDAEKLHNAEEKIGHLNNRISGFESEVRGMGQQDFEQGEEIERLKFALRGSKKQCDLLRCSLKKAHTFIGDLLGVQ